MTQTLPPHLTPNDQDVPPGAWPALWAMAAGFFMIMIDTTIVSVSIPSIMRAFNTDVAKVIWVSSAYLLAYAVPLLITGRLGDRVGPRRVYLPGSSSSPSPRSPAASSARSAGSSPPASCRASAPR